MILDSELDTLLECFVPICDSDSLFGCFAPFSDSAADSDNEMNQTGI